VWGGRVNHPSLPDWAVMGKVMFVYTGQRALLFRRVISMAECNGE